MKRLISFLFLLSLFIRAFAPSRESIIVGVPAPVEPYSRLIYAVGMVEGKGDTSAYNDREKAAGFFQIRPVRLEDYNERTGNHYTLKDMFNYKIAKKIFLYYAEQIGPYDFERISRNWNGRGAKTIQYWNRIKQYL